MRQSRCITLWTIKCQHPRFRKMYKYLSRRFTRFIMNPCETCDSMSQKLIFFWEFDFSYELNLCWGKSRDPLRKMRCSRLPSHYESGLIWNTKGMVCLRNHRDSIQPLFLYDRTTEQRHLLPEFGCICDHLQLLKQTRKTVRIRWKDLDEWG